jgi:archaeosortase B (VPXXXP-CTERM-specific)
MKKKRISKKQEINESNNTEIITFIKLYVLFMAAFIILYILLKKNLDFLNYATAGALSSILVMLGTDSTFAGSMVTASNFSCNVIDECTGLYEIIVYAACVLAYPTSTNKKLIGIAMGTPLLIIINMIRLLFLTFIGMWYTNLFDFFHYIIWQITLIIFVAGVLLLWIFTVVKK